MPYIPGDRRAALAQAGFDPSVARKFEGPGELNYAITMLCIEYVNSRGGINYTVLNAVIGALSCAQAEFYRRAVADYETIKGIQNGDVYREGQ